MNPAIYPLIGFLTGMLGGWIWQNLWPGAILAIVLSLLAGVFSLDLRTIGVVDYIGVGLGATLAGLMSFFGSVAGTLLKNYFERK